MNFGLGMEVLQLVGFGNPSMLFFKASDIGYFVLLVDAIGHKPDKIVGILDKLVVNEAVPMPLLVFFHSIQPTPSTVTYRPDVFIVSLLLFASKLFLRNVNGRHMT